MTMTTTPIISSRTFTNNFTSAATTLPATTTSIQGTVTVTALSTNTVVEVDGQISEDGGVTWATRWSMAAGRGSGTFGGCTGQMLVEGSDLGGARARAVVTLSGTNPTPSATLSANLTVTS